MNPLAPGPVCPTISPDWNISQGAVTGWAQALDAAMSLPVLFLIGVVLAAFFSGKRIIAFAAITLSACLGLMLWAVQLDPDSTRARAVAEGCVGPPGPTFAIFAIAAGLALVPLIRGPRR